MIQLFLCTLFAWLATAWYSIVLKKRVIGLNLFVLTGIYFPMALYSLGWSAYVDNKPADEFYYIFSCLNCCLILFNLLVKDESRFDIAIIPNRVSTRFVFVADFVFVSLFLFESYLGSGSLFPALAGKDIHTYSAPVIAFVTRNLFLIVSLNVITFLINRKKKYLFLAFFLIALPVVTRSMRITALTALIQVGLFCYLYYTANKKRSTRPSLAEGLRKRVKKHRFATALALVVAVACVFGAAAMTNDRMSHYGKYDLKYSTEIAYTGPDFLPDVIPVYYGYFPMSFNNLNLSLKYGTAEHNYVGLYSYKSVYFGILQFDNVFGLNPAEPDASGHRVSASNSANVATGFWDYWYDYGYLCFIPIGLMILICGWITRRTQWRPTLFMYLQYCYFLPLVFFESFQNVFFGAETLVEVAFALVVVKFAFSSETVGNGSVSSVRS